MNILNSLVISFGQALVVSVPFLVWGVWLSGLIAVYLPDDSLPRQIPRQRGAGILFGLLLAVAVPLTIIGLIPIARRLMWKGLPAYIGVTFLAAGPLINPIAIFNYLANLDWQIVLVMLFVVILMAIIIGWAFSMWSADHVRPDHYPVAVSDQLSRPGRFWLSLTVAGDEFLEMVRYLIAAALLTAVVDTMIPTGQWLSWVSAAPLDGVLVLLLFVFVLGASWFGLGQLVGRLATTVAPGSLISATVLGSVLTAPSLALLLATFRGRSVLVFSLLTIMLNLLLGIIINGVL